MLGLYVSDHPLFGVEHIIARESDCSLADLMSDDTELRPRSGDRSDAQIIKVPMEQMPWSNRKSQQNVMMNSKAGEMSIAHVGKSSGQ